MKLLTIMFSAILTFGAYASNTDEPVITEYYNSGFRLDNNKLIINTHLGLNSKDDSNLDLQCVAMKNQIEKSLKNISESHGTELFALDFHKTIRTRGFNQKLYYCVITAELINNNFDFKIVETDKFSLEDRNNFAVTDPNVVLNAKKIQTANKNVINFFHATRAPFSFKNYLEFIEVTTKENL